jgi:hypothetical protein
LVAVIQLSSERRDLKAVTRHLERDTGLASNHQITVWIAANDQRVIDRYACDRFILLVIHGI